MTIYQTGQPSYPSSTVVEEFYFKAMLSAYASGSPPDAVADRPGYWIFRYTDPEFKLFFEDIWFEVPFNNFTTGTTTIYYIEGDNKTPIWIMSYYGHYEQEAHPLLKLALKKAFDERLFKGGRGKPGIKLEEMIYHNYPDARGSFNHFSGLEKITRNGICLGLHYYVGHLLV